MAMTFLVSMDRVLASATRDVLVVGDVRPLRGCALTSCPAGQAPRKGRDA